MKNVFKYAQKGLRKFFGYSGAIDGKIGATSETALNKIHFIANTGWDRERKAFAYAQFRINGEGARLEIDGISKDIEDLGGFRDRAVIRVRDTRHALGRLAAAYRRELKAVIVGITGSNGKTTVKDLVAHLLQPVGPVVSAKKSFNNDVGLPLTILSMDRETKVGVVEMGTNNPGEIAALCRIARPDLPANQAQ